MPGAASGAAAGTSCARAAATHVNDIIKQNASRPGMSFAFQKTRGEHIVRNGDRVRLRRVDRRAVAVLVIRHLAIQREPPRLVRLDQLMPPGLLRLQQTAREVVVFDLRFEEVVGADPGVRGCPGATVG